MLNHKFHCHGCGGQFQHRPGADLFCSAACREKHEARQDDAEGQLRTAGFRRYLSTPNLWEKGGVVISIEQVLREGLDHALNRHAQALEQRKKQRPAG
ncbi:MAG TPA: hypothetical protein VKU44_06845 [Terriglobia bacterium]|nr:hypothetical protein [Terriglobia bacterium]